MEYDFVWSPAKARVNFRTHRVTFRRATQVFRDADALSLFDEEHSEFEERWITIGRDQNHVLLVVVHTYEELNDENAKIRIISARKAVDHERAQYRARG